MSAASLAAFDPTPHTRESVLAALAQEREHRARLEREAKDLRHKMYLILNALGNEHLPAAERITAIFTVLAYEREQQRGITAPNEELPVAKAYVAKASGQGSGAVRRHMDVLDKLGFSKVRTEEPHRVLKETADGEKKPTVECTTYLQLAAPSPQEALKQLAVIGANREEVLGKKTPGGLPKDGHIVRNVNGTFRGICPNCGSKGTLVKKVYCTNCGEVACEESIPYEPDPPVPQVAVPQDAAQKGEYGAANCGTGIPSESCEPEEGGEDTEEVAPSSCVDPPPIDEAGQGELEWLPPIPGNFARELVNLPRHWMWSKPIPRGDGTYSKPPYSAHTGLRGSKTDPKDRGTVYEALDAMKRYGGRFVRSALDGDEGLVFADLDHCVDVVTGEVESWARSVVDALPSMRWELSPSCTGLHGCGRGVKPARSGCRWKIGEHEIEVYSAGAFVTVTGHPLPGTSVRMSECTEDLAALHRRLYPPQPPATRNGHALVPGFAGDPQVCERVQRKHGAGFLQELLSMPDDSGRDYRAARWCADFTQDPDQLERILGSWGLREARPDPEKWDRPEYLQRTISRAIESAKLR